MLLEAAKSFRAAGMERIRSMHVGGATGREVVEKITALTDDILRGVVAAVFDSEPMPFSIVSVGGYGRGEQSPGSDVDVLFLCDDLESNLVKKSVEKFLYPLWDLKLDVGYSVREIGSCLNMAKRDFTVLTSLLDARTVAGDEQRLEKLWEKLRDKVLPAVTRAFIREKAVDLRERRNRFGDSIYLLEPNVRESPGGLRDLHTAIWTSKVLHRARSLDELKEKGVIHPQELGRVESALDFIWTVRNELHFQAKRKEDRLTFQGQERIALFLDYRDRGSVRAVEQFMRDYYLQADTLRHFTNRLIEEARHAIENRRKEIDLGGGLYISGGEISASNAESLAGDPGMLLRIFTVAAEHKARISPTLLHTIYQSRPALNGNAAALDEKPLGQLWKLFEYEGGVSYLIEDMHEAGALGIFFPEFEALRRQVQHDAYHIYTTDMHSILTVRELERMKRGEAENELPLFIEVARQIQDWPLLLLIGLMHDLGKGIGKSHAERGSRMMPAIAARLGLSEEQAETISFIVRNHLEMAQASQKRDLSEPGLVGRFAQLIQDEERLKMLTLLTVADQRAVGPEAWSDWKRALLAELYLKALRLLEKGPESWEEMLARRERTSKTLIGLLHDELSPERIEFNMKTLPQRFFLSRKSDNIARCLRVIESLRDAAAGGVLVAEHLDAPDGRTTEFIISTWDAPGLFAKITGVLAANSVNILSADIYTRTDGAVLDIFRVNDPAGGPVVDPEKWAKIKGDLFAAFTGALNVALRVSRRKKPLINIKRAPYRPPRIEFDQESSEKCTIIEVYAHDRVGLLFDITHTLTGLGLYIDRAIIATEVDQAADVFYVKDIFGQKIREPEKMKRIKEKLMSVLEEPGES